MKFTKLAVSILAGAMLFCGCTKDSSVIIKVNDIAITQKEFNKEFNIVKNIQFKNMQEQPKENDLATLSIKNQVIKTLIVKTLLKQEFDKRQITASSQELENKKNQIIKQMGSKEKLNEILKYNHIPNDAFIENISTEIKVDKLSKALNIGNVTDKEAQNFYKNNKSNFDLPERVNVSHILISTNKDEIKRTIVDADKAAKLSSADIDSKVEKTLKENEELVQKIYKEAKANPKNFAALAKKYSQDKGSAQKGGDLGFAPRGQFVPEFEQVAFSTKVGTIAAPVKTQYGTHIIYVKDKAAKGVQDFAKVKEDIKTYLAQQKKFDEMNKYIMSLKDNAKVEYIDKEYSPEVLDKKIEAARNQEAEKIKAEMQKTSDKKNK